MRLVWIFVVTAIAVTGCRKRTEIGILDDDDGPKSLLGCGDGTHEYGQLPPAATEMWCAKDSGPGTTAVRHGPSRSWYPDGRPASVGAYADGQRTGHWWFWTSDGRLEKEGDFLNGAEVGYWTLYREDGTVLSEGPMKDGGRHGVWVSYDATNGVPQEGLWVDGQKDGVWTEYDADGKALRERVFRLGRQISLREIASSPAPAPTPAPTP